MSEMIISRRAVLAGSGALIFSFSSAAVAQDTVAPAPAAPAPAAPPTPPPLPGSLKQAPFLDSWIRVDANGAITVFTGKA
jgi:nicotinate dehydrogenase subunit B